MTITLRPLQAGRAALVIAALLVAGTHPSAQQPGVVRGRVSIGVPITAKRPSSTYSRSVAKVALAPESELRHVVVYLKDAPRSAVAPMHAEIRQENENFVPRVVAVTVGSEVEFPNFDPIYHNVFSLSWVKSFDLGRFREGQTRKVRFDKPGVVKVFCQIHSHMSATVMVFEHPWFAIPGDRGTFELPAIPPGSRQLTAWHERLGDTTVRVQIDAGRAATTDFVLPVPTQ